MVYSRKKASIAKAVMSIVTFFDSTHQGSRPSRYFFFNQYIFLLHVLCFFLNQWIKNNCASNCLGSACACALSQNRDIEFHWIIKQIKIDHTARPTIFVNLKFSFFVTFFYFHLFFCKVNKMDKKIDREFLVMFFHFFNSNWNKKQTVQMLPPS